ncbi:hypothetical protein ACM66B_001183 [Microbotryomycetes sp. NB124-2]
MPSADSSRLRVVVVGAGIAGLAAATALREHEVIVLEQSRMNQEIGAAIHLGPNAARIAIDRWGMKVENMGSPNVRWYKELNHEGKIQINAPIDTLKGFGAPWLLNHRVDLHSELKRLATTSEGPGSPAVVKTASKVKSVNCEEGIVELEDGETVRGDVIVGADGIHSVTRAAILGEKIVAQPTGHSAYRCLIPAEKVRADPELAWLVDVSNPGLATFVGHDRRVVAYPCRRCEYLNIVAIIPDTSLQSESAQVWNAPGSVEELVEAFSYFSETVKRLLSMAPSCGLWQLRDQDPLPTWTKGRAIIIGDAAHAMLPHQGQGGGQAVEDAEALGALLKGVTNSSQVPQVLEQVQKVRYQRATNIQGFSRQKALGAREGETFTLNAQEFVPYNFGYNGAVEWAKKNNIELVSAEA